MFMGKIVSITIEPVKICGTDVKLKIEAFCDWDNLNENQKVNLLVKLIRKLVEPWMFIKEVHI